MSVFCTTAYPSFTSHFSPLFHFERSLPSKSTTASEGGSASVLPGVTTFGSGQTMPLLYSCWSPVRATVTPELTATRLRVKEPGASYQGFRSVDDPRQHLLFLPETELELTLIGSEPLADAQLKVHPGTPPDLKRADEQTFTANWTLREAATLEIVLTSAQTTLSSKPTFLSIGLLKDREPRVTLRAVGVGGHVTPVATIPLTVASSSSW